MATAARARLGFLDFTVRLTLMNVYHSLVLMEGHVWILLTATAASVVLNLQ